MAHLAARLFLVCYDIADPDRLVRVHRYLAKIALPLQYSVFLLHTSQEGIVSVLHGLAHIIDKREDDVRAYPVPKRLEYVHYGRQPFPDGVVLDNADQPGFRLLAGLENPKQTDDD